MGRRGQGKAEAMKAKEERPYSLLGSKCGTLNDEEITREPEKNMGPRSFHYPP
jgi:hypothetical protein